MQATLTEEQQLIAESAERMALDGRKRAQGVLMGEPWPAEPDGTLLDDWSGLGIPENRGGAGGGLVDVALVLKALAETLTPNRFATRAMALQVTLSAGLPLDSDPVTPLDCCLAVSESDTGPLGPFACRQVKGVLRGQKIGVPHGADSKLAVVVLDGDEVALAIPNHRQSTTAADLLNPTARLDFDNVRALAVGTGAKEGLRRATALLAAELCGIARGAVTLAAEYANARVQFGKPIGAFQGVAHQLADALVAAETAWSLTLYACWALDKQTVDAGKAVHTAKARASEAAVFAAERCLQIHGGMGMTWEAAPHLYLRRALAASAWLGGAHWHRCHVGRALLAQVRERERS